MSHDRSLRTLIVALAVVGGACSSSNGNGGGSGGQAGAGTSSGGVGSGGRSAAGGASASGGTQGSGGSTATAGAPGSGGQLGSGGAAAGGGTPSSGGQTGSGGAATGSGGTGRDAGADIAVGTGGGSGAGGASATSDGGTVAAMPSAGCGKPSTLKNSPGTTINYNKITSSGRQYILRLPENYDNSRPYRLVLAYHWYSGSASQVFDCTTEGITCSTTQSPFFGLWNLSKDSTIFIAPDGVGSPQGWYNTNGEDMTFTDDILKEVENDLCVDTTRVFANGFSFGAVFSAQLACTRPKVFRAVGVYSGGVSIGNAPGGPCDGASSPVAYYGSHGTSDGSAKYEYGTAARDLFVKNNGCTAQTTPTPPSGGHVCTSYDGCSTGHPVRWCAFDGPHTPSPKDNGASSTWDPQEAWNFFTQF